MAGHSQCPNGTIFSRNLKRAQAEAGLANRQLANILGISESLLGKYRRGSVQPGLDNAIKLAEVLGRPVEWFTEDHEDPVAA